MELKENYVRITRVLANQAGRPQAEATAYAYTREDWNEMRIISWDSLPEYIAQEPARRRLAKARAQEAKAAAKCKELEAAAIQPKEA
jgi:hypothetical protein